MITADYLFDKKIIWLGNDSICSNNFSYFKEQLITVLEALMPKHNSKIFKNKIEDSFDTIKEIERELKDEDQCLWYIRLFRLGQGYKMSFYSGDEFELEDAMAAHREWVDDGFKPLKWSDIVGDTDIDSYGVFDKLNESFDNTLVNKKIWFNFPTERKDIEKVNQFLIDNGYRGLRPDNIDEFEDFIYDHEVAYFYLIQHDSPLHSEERRKPYVDYSYMDHPNPYRLKAKPDWIYYKDILEMSDTTIDILSNLNESVEPTPKVGDFLYCHAAVIMEDDGDEEATVGKFYPIIKVSPNRNRLEIINNSKTDHVFSLDPEEDWHYSKWFNLVPREDKESMERFDVEDVFNKLNESFELESTTNYSGLQFTFNNNGIVYTLSKPCTNRQKLEGYMVEWQPSKKSKVTHRHCYSNWAINSYFKEGTWVPYTEDINTTNIFSNLE